MNVFNVKIEFDSPEAICIDGTSESVRAYGICDTEDVHWVLTDKNILYIFGEGEMDKGIESWSEDAVPWCYYRNFIDKVVIDEGITDIGGYAFYQCPNLNEITIPSTVSRIHSYAFLSVEYLNKPSEYSEHIILPIAPEPFTLCNTPSISGISRLCFSGSANCLTSADA